MVFWDNFMKKFKHFCFTILIVGMTPPARAQRAPVVISSGWETSIHALAPVSSDSELGREFPGGRLVVGFSYDQYWFIVPIWNSRGSFVICKEFKDDEKPNEFWVLKEQDVGKISPMLGVPGDRLKKPLFYYVPPSWFLIAAIVVAVGLMSGPGPDKRFRRLWTDPRYRTAVAGLLDLETAIPTDFEVIVLAGPIPDPSAKIDEVVDWLGQQGISRRKGTRNLNFMIEYLIENQKVVQADPAQDVDPGHDAGKEGSEESEPGMR